MFREISGWNGYIGQEWIWNENIRTDWQDLEWDWYDGMLKTTFTGRIDF